MGQQQLLLIVLGVIIVGISIAVGVTQFKSGAVDSNRQAVIGDLVNLGAKAQRFYRTPTTLAGGGQNFQNFQMYEVDYENSNGSFRMQTTEPSAAGACPTAATSNTKVGSSASTIYLVGWGKEVGNDNSNYVEVYAKVTADSITTTVLN